MKYLDARMRKPFATHMNEEESHVSKWTRCQSEHTTKARSNGRAVVSSGGIMKFSEAMAALEEGKKVRRINIQKVFGLDENGELFYEASNEKSFTLFPEDVVATDWEIYQEPEDTELYLFRCKVQGIWYVEPQLQTISEASDLYRDYEGYEIHSGPYEVGKGER